LTQGSQNIALYTVIIVSIVVGTFLFAAQGCDMQSVIRVDVPADVVATVAPDELDGKITLDEVERVWEDWNAYVIRNTERFKAAIEDANERYYALTSLVDLGIGIANDASGTFPGGAVIMSILGVATGMFIKRPGEDKRVATEKEESYNAGLKKARELISEQFSGKEEKS
jgi:hypothetical protein